AAAERAVAGDDIDRLVWIDARDQEVRLADGKLAENVQAVRGAAVDFDFKRAADVGAANGERAEIVARSDRAGEVDADGARHGAGAAQFSGGLDDDVAGGQVAVDAQRAVLDNGIAGITERAGENI